MITIDYLFLYSCLLVGGEFIDVQYPDERDKIQTAYPENCMSNAEPL